MWFQRGKSVKCTTWQNSRNCVTFLHSHYLTFSERPREAFGPVACVNYDQEVHNRITKSREPACMCGVREVAWVWAPKQIGGGVRSLVYTGEFPIYNVGVGPFHYNHFSFQYTAVPPKKPDWGGMDDLASSIPGKQTTLPGAGGGRAGCPEGGFMVRDSSWRGRRDGRKVEFKRLSSRFPEAHYFYFK